MDNLRELARLLRKAQDLHFAKTRPRIWMVTNKSQGEDPPLPLGGVEVFEPWLVFGCIGKRPERDAGKPEGKLCPLS